MARERTLAAGVRHSHANIQHNLTTAAVILLLHDSSINRIANE